MIKEKEGLGKEENLGLGGGEVHLLEPELHGLKRFLNQEPKEIKRLTINRRKGVKDLVELFTAEILQAAIEVEVLGSSEVVPENVVLRANTELKAHLNTIYY